MSSNHAIGLCSQLIDCIKDQESHIVALTGRLDSLSITLETKERESKEFETTIEALKDTIKTLESKMASYEDEIRTLQTDHEEFTKVSQVVSLEKEVHKLKSENDILKDRIERLLKKPPQQPVEEEQSFPVYEKTIKGITYYISDNADMIIFNISEDGSVGSRVGQLIKVEGKTKIQWD